MPADLDDQGLDPRIRTCPAQPAEQVAQMCAAHAEQGGDRVGRLPFQDSVGQVEFEDQRGVAPVASVFEQVND